MEKPILFSAPMVQAILEDKKGMTRRVIKPQPMWRKAPVDKLISDGWAWMYGGTKLEAWPDAEKFAKELAKYCPYGKPGDTLWVRETTYLFGKWVKNGTTKIGKQKWKFVWDNSQPVFYEDCKPSDVKRLKSEIGYFKRPSIFMPRKAARLFLTVKNIRVERLQDITEEDAIAEGVKAYGPNNCSGTSARIAFAELWDSLNEKRGYGWDTNPWVWVVEFEKK